MRRKLRDISYTNPVGLSERGKIDRTRRLIFLNLFLIVTFLGTTMIVFSHTSQSENSDLRLVDTDSAQMQSLTGFQVNPVVLPGWK